MASGASNSSLLSSLPKVLPRDFLGQITDGFSAERKLGQGSIGTVYQGILNDGTSVAVKKIGENSPVTADKQFQNEVGNLMVIQHDNIVKVIGYCYEKQKKVVEQNGRYILADTVESFLCYEYLPTSLGKHIFAESYRDDWVKRFKIIEGICQGIHFLHKGMDIPVIHMDLKPDNVLLSDDMVPKIADFGLSRLFGQEQTRMFTQTVVGSYGYMAPEYLYRGEISLQTDIYSLGILIIEITTREKNNSTKEDMSSRKYIDNARQNWTSEYITSKYSHLPSDHLQQIKICVDIGLKCVEIDRKNRPIEDIIKILDGSFAG